MKRLLLNESQLHNIIMNSVINILKESKYMNNCVYIVFDGTSHYAVYGCDVDDEIDKNGVEIVKGPFASWDDRVDSMIEDLNNEAYGNNY